MKYLKKYINTIKAEPLIFFIGLCILMLAVMGTSVRHVSSSVFAILVLLSFSVIKDWARLYLSLPKLEKLFLLAFFLYTVSGMLSFYNVDDVDKYYKILERYLRFSLIIPVYLLFIKKQITVLNYLYLGAVLSGPVLMIVALQHYFESPDVPAQGYYHHIIFGQLAMLNVGLMLALLLSRNLSQNVKLLILVSIGCGIVTAVLSQARGAWLALPVYVLIAIYFSIKTKRLSAKNVASIIIVSALLLIATPVGDVIKQRTEAAVMEVTNYYAEDEYATSIGTRLAMWGIAVDVWQRHTLLGTGPGDFDDEVIALQKAGKYKGMEIHNSVHNIYVQALVGAGIVGLLALLFVVLIMPLRIFLYKEHHNKDGRLAGFITIVSFAVFGVSESWTLRLSSISIFLIYIIVIASHVRIVNSQDNN